MERGKEHMQVPMQAGSTRSDPVRSCSSYWWRRVCPIHYPFQKSRNYHASLLCSLTNHKDLPNSQHYHNNSGALSWVFEMYRNKDVKLNASWFQKKKKKKSTKPNSVILLRQESVSWVNSPPWLQVRWTGAESVSRGLSEKHTSLKGRSGQWEHKGTPMTINKMNGFGLLLKYDISARIL